MTIEEILATILMGVIALETLILMTMFLDWAFYYKPKKAKRVSNFGAFDPNETVKGAAVNRGMGNDALFNPHDEIDI